MAVRYLDDGNDDGTCLGQTAAQLVAFWGKTPIAQPAAAAQSAVTNTTTTTSTTTALTTDLDSLRGLVLAMRTALVNTGIMKGSA